MKAEDIVKKYPNLFRDYGGDMMQTGMAWGFECGKGWLPLIDEIGRQLIKIDVEKHVVADQVKERFGELRFYYHTENLPISIWDWSPNNYYLRRFWYHKYMRGIRKYFTKIRRFFYKSLYEKIDDIIDTTEIKSYITCEICGKDGKITGQSWLKTLCGDCDENRNISK